MASSMLRDVGKSILLHFAQATYDLQPKALESKEESHEYAFTLDDVQSEKERFLLWAANIGLYAMGDRSLDYRIRDHQGVKKYTQELLDELCEDLVDLHNLLTGNLNPDIAVNEEDEENYSDTVEDEDPDSGASDDGIRDKVSLQEAEVSQDIPVDTATRPGFEAAQSIFSDIVDIIDRLYRLASRLRSTTNRAPPSAKNFYREPYIDADGQEILLSKSERAEARVQSEGFHERRIEEIIRQAHRDQASKPSPDEIEIPKFSSHAKAVIHRVAVGNAYRQQQFMFWRQREWERRNVATRQTQAPEILEVRPVHQASLNPAKSKVTFSEAPSNTWKIPYQNVLVPVEETRSVSLKTEQTATPTVYEPSGRKVEWPPFPQRLAGKKEFICPYCFVTCSPKYRGKEHWRSHLIQDLQPYSCTAHECPEGDSKPLNTWDEWMVHEQVYHRTNYICPDHPTEPFPSKDSYVEHISSLHASSKDTLLTAPAIDQHAQFMPKPTNPCPLCPYKADSWPDMNMHLAVHLESLALLALPLATGLEQDDEQMESVHPENDDHDGRELLDDNAAGAITGLFETEESPGNGDEEHLPQGRPLTLETLKELQGEPGPKNYDHLADQIGRLNFQDRAAPSGNNHWMRDFILSQDLDKYTKPVYAGFTFVKAAAIPPKQVVWKKIERSDMNLSQEELAKLVQKKPKGCNYGDLTQMKRGHVEDLLDEFKEDHPMFNWTCVYAKEHRKIIDETRYETLSMDIIIAGKPNDRPNSQIHLVRDDIPRNTNNQAQANRRMLNDNQRQFAQDGQLNDQWKEHVPQQSQQHQVPHMPPGHQPSQIHHRAQPPQIHQDQQRLHMHPVQQGEPAPNENLDDSLASQDYQQMERPGSNAARGLFTFNRQVNPGWVLPMLVLPGVVASGLAFPWSVSPLLFKDLIAAKHKLYDMDDDDDLSVPKNLTVADWSPLDD